MLQFPAFMTQYPWSMRMIPTSLLLPSQSPQPHNEDILLAMEESNFEEKCNEIRTMNKNLVVIGRTVENDKEDVEAEDDDADNAEESEGEEFEQEIG